MSKRTFMYWGKTADTCTFGIPYPSSGIFESARTVTLSDSASGEVVGQLVGRTRHKQNMTWNVLDRDTWWEMNNWLEENISDKGFSFYCRYFNFNTGKWQTKQFYAGNPTCTPFGVNSDETDDDFGMPKMLLNCTLNVIDCGILEDGS